MYEGNYDYIFGEKASQDINLIPLSNNTVGRRINVMFNWVEKQLIKHVTNNSFYSLQIDESTDIQGLCQLLVFICYIFNHASYDELLFCKSIIRGTSTEIFNTLNQMV